MQHGDTVTVVQFTDTHFFGDADGRLLGVDTARSFAAVRDLSQAEMGAPDLYLLTGDLSQDETEQSYARFAQAIEQLSAPAYYLPGNHDARAQMQAAFAGSKAQLPAARHLLAGNWLIVLLDTQIPGKIGGRLSSEELARLDELLTAHADRHALVAMHHHPLPVGCRWIDRIGVENGDEFFAVVDRHRQVKAVLWGHIHQQFESERQGVRLLASPSTCVQFKPKSDDFAIDVVPPGYRWLKLHADGRLESGVKRTAHVAEGLNPALKGY